MRMIVGLTGMSGAGKTTVSDRFKIAGYYVINCDKTARKAVEKGSPALPELSAEFGSDIINSDGSLNRALLAQRAFGNAERTAKLNSIMLAYIVELINAEIEFSDSDLILLDAPTLFQAGADKLCSCTIAVVAERETCIERIMARDGITRGQAEARLNSQFSADYFAENCTYLISNNGDVSDLQSKTDEIIKIINEG